MGLKLNGATSGSIEIDVPAVAGTDTAITIPATTGGEFIVSDSSGNIDLGPLDINGGAADNSVNIDGSGRLLVGTSTARANFLNGSVTALGQIEGNGDGATRGTFSVINNATTEHPATLLLGRSNNNALNSNTLVADDDWCGRLGFQGNDGTEFVELASISGFVDGTPGADDMPGRLVFSTTADGATTPTERMRIRSTNTATIMMNCTASNDTGVLQLRNTVGTAHCLCLGTSASSGNDTLATFRFACNADGSGGTEVGTIRVTSTATQYNTSSDYRLKENITPVTDGITRVKQLNPSRFNFIIEPNRTVDGFIAHEVQAVVPEAISGEKDAIDDNGDPVYQGIDQSKLVPLLTAALQEAIAKIETLETRVAQLEGGAA